MKARGLLPIVGSVSASMLVLLGTLLVAPGVAASAMTGPAMVDTQLAGTQVEVASAVGETEDAAAFSVATKVVPIVAASNNIATIRARLSPALVGQSVILWVASKSAAGAWSDWTRVSSRPVGSDGYAYFLLKSHSAQWLSFRGTFAGNAGWAPSVPSQTVQVRWM